MEVDDQYRIKLHPPALQTGPLFFRKFSEMQPVLMDQTTKPPQPETYSVFRGIQLADDVYKIKDNRLSYDVTIIPSLMLGVEFNKTLGHYHEKITGTQYAHPEMYEVLSGKALFFLQKMDPELKNLITILAIEAETGHKVIYPPNYAHIIVNIGNQPLVTANWISTDYKPMYEPIRDRQGMAYYVVPDKHGYKFEKNPKYSEHPVVRMVTVEDTISKQFGFTLQEPMYVTAMRDSMLLEFLNNPKKYAVQLSTIAS